MPTSLKLQEEYGDDLQVIFVEVQGATLDEAEAFALDRKWLGTGAMWTTERFVMTGLEGIPQFVLLGADGRVLEKGHHTSSSTKDLIAEEVAGRKKGPADAPKALAAAWKAFGKGEVAKAVEAARKVGAKEELAAAAEEAVATFLSRTEGDLDRIAWCLDHGYVLEGKDRLDALRGKVKGIDELAARVEALEARLDADEMKTELEAAKTLRRILDRLHEDGFGKGDKNKKSLEQFAKQFAGTASADRASHLLALPTD